MFDDRWCLKRGLAARRNRRRHPGWPTRVHRARGSPRPPPLTHRHARGRSTPSALGPRPHRAWSHDRIQKPAPPRLTQPGCAVLLTEDRVICSPGVDSGPRDPLNVTIDLRTPPALSRPQRLAVNRGSDTLAARSASSNANGSSACTSVSWPITSPYSWKDQLGDREERADGGCR